MTSYFDKLNNLLWQKKRLRVFERENFACQLCKTADKILHIHHTYYKPDYKLWDYPLESLMCLCDNCHKEQKWKKEYLEFINEQIKNINMDIFIVEEIVGYIHMHKIINAGDRNIVIKITPSIIDGMCIIQQRETKDKKFVGRKMDLKMDLYDFLMDCMEKEGKETITYGEIIDFIDSQKTKE